MGERISNSAKISSDSWLSGEVFVYNHATVNNSVLEDKSSVGDFSKVEDSKLEEFVRIGRYNYVTRSQFGKDSYTGMNTVVMNSKIGNFCSISWGVTIGPSEHNFNNVTTHSFLYENYSQIKPKDLVPYDRFSKHCIIGNDVWIGCNSTILRNVNIGNGAVIGANSLVTKDVPPYAIVGGVPAKVIKYRFDKEIINLLLELKWWDWNREDIKKNYDFFTNSPNKNMLIDLIEKTKGEKLL